MESLLIKSCFIISGEAEGVHSLILLLFQEILFFSSP